MNGETKKKSVGSVLYDDVMGGLRPMIPFVAGGGILMAIGDNSVNQFAKILYEIGHNNAMLLMIPIFAGFIAHTIAGQDALAPGMIGGMIAKTTGSGFLGGIVAGFLAGYLVKLLNKLLSNFPEDFQSIKKLLIIPVISTFVVGIVMLCVVSVPMAWLNQGLTGFIDGLGTQNLVLTGMVIGMMAVDLGGPINKVAYTFAVAAISNGNYYPMAAAMVGGVVPPLGVALATTLFKRKFTKDQQIQGKTYYLLGASFITESCMPVALTDPVRMIPAGIIGSAVAGGLAMLFQISLPAPHGGIFVTPVVEGAISQKLLYLAAITIGMLVSALIIGFTKKPLKEQEA